MDTTAVLVLALRVFEWATERHTILSLSILT